MKDLQLIKANLSAFLVLLKAKRRNEGETWTQPSGRKVTKKNGKIVPVSEGKRLKKEPQKNNGGMKPFVISEKQYQQLYYENKKAKLYSAMSKGCELMEKKISEMDIDDFENEYDLQLFDSYYLNLDAEDRVAKKIIPSHIIEDIINEFPDEKITENMKYNDFSSDVQDYLDSNYLAPDSYYVKKEYEDVLGDLKKELEEELENASGEFKEKSKEIYEKKDSFLKSYQPDEIHEIHGKYYFYYGKGEKGFHRPIDRDLTEEEENNAKVLNDFEGENYKNASRILEKIKSEANQILINNKIKFNIEEFEELYSEYQDEQREQFEMRQEMREYRKMGMQVEY